MGIGSPDNSEPRKRLSKRSKPWRLAFCLASIALALLLLIIMASMELPITRAAARHEFHFTQLTVAQQRLDLLCGLPKLHSATEFTPNSSKLNKLSALEKSSKELVKLGIHYVLALPDGAPCPTDIPAKDACSLESAVATGMPVKIWTVPFKSRHECPVVHRKAYSLVPLSIDMRSPLGRWYHDHRHDLWTQKFPDQATRSSGQQGDLSIVADFLRLYVLRYRGGGTYLDTDVQVLDPALFEHLPESVAAQEQTNALKFHGLHRYNKYD